MNGNLGRNEAAVPERQPAAARRRRARSRSTGATASRGSPTSGALAASSSRWASGSRSTAAEALCAAPELASVAPLSARGDREDRAAASRGRSGRRSPLWQHGFETAWRGFPASFHAAHRRARSARARNAAESTGKDQPMFARTFIFLYGIASYAVFLVAFLYAIGFVGNLSCRSRSTRAAPGLSPRRCSSTLLLLGIFAIQHSVMARPAFKRWWTRIIPRRVRAQHLRAGVEPAAPAALLAMAADPRAKSGTSKARPDASR